MSWKDGEHHWWETLFGLSLTVTETFNFVLHPVVITLTLTLLCLLLIIVLYIKGWYIIKQITQLQPPQTHKLIHNE